MDSNFENIRQWSKCLFSNGENVVLKGKNVFFVLLPKFCPFCLYFSLFFLLAVSSVLFLHPFSSSPSLPFHFSLYNTLRMGGFILEIYSWERWVGRLGKTGPHSLRKTIAVCRMMASCRGSALPSRESKPACPRACQVWLVSLATPPELAPCRG